jgi:hypothetical protein
MAWHNLIQLTTPQTYAATISLHQTSSSIISKETLTQNLHRELDSQGQAAGQRLA